jgi:hypothetical protein
MVQLVELWTIAVYGSGISAVLFKAVEPWPQGLCRFDVQFDFSNVLYEILNGILIVYAVGRLLHPNSRTKQQDSAEEGEIFSDLYIIVYLNFHGFCFIVTAINLILE